MASKDQIVFEEVAPTLPSTVQARFVLAQKDMEQPTFDSKNPHFKSRYSSLSEVLRVVLPALHKYGLSLKQPVEFNESIPNLIFVHTVIVADNGNQMDLGIYPVSIDAPQKMGAAISYARRYALTSALARTAEDNDAETEDDSGNSWPCTAACRVCGTRYQFESREQMAQTTCKCPKPEWVRE